MTVEEQLRAYGRSIEQRRIPITADEAMNDETAMFDDAGVGEPRSPRGRWMLAAATLTMLVAATVGLVTLGGDGDESPETPIDSPLTNTVPLTTVPVTTPATPTTTETAPSTTTTETAPATTTPTIALVLSDLLGDDAAAIGETVTFDDGAVARVNSVVVDAPPRNNIYVSDQDPDTLTEFEIERCLGDDAATDVEQSSQSPAYQKWLNRSRFMLAGQWIAVFDDGTSVPGRPGHHPHLAFDSGGCVRGQVFVPTPDNTNVIGVVLLPDRCCYALWKEQYWEPDLPSDRVRDADAQVDWLRRAVGWDFTRSQPIDGPLRPSVPPDTVAVGEAMATGFSFFDITVLEVIEDADPRPHVFVNVSGGPQLELPPQPGPGRKLVEVRAEICTPADRPGLPGGGSYAGTDELLWLIATDNNYIGHAFPESFNGTVGDRLWEDRDNFIDPPVMRTSNLLSNGSDEPNSTEGTLAPSPAPGECNSGYVQIDLPDDATPVDVIVASEAGGEDYNEVGRTRITDPS